MNSNYSRLQRLDGKVVLVTGAAGTLGRQFCEGFGEMGAAVAVADLDAGVCAGVAAQLRRDYKIPSVGIACDVSQPGSVDLMVRRVVSELGGVDILHNNAATKGRDIRAFFTSFEEYPLELWREVMAVNIDGMFLMAQRVGRQMIAQGRGGSVIQMSSIYAKVGPDQRIYEGSHYLGGNINTPAVYSASKAAVMGLTRHLAAYWAAHRIRVNCLVPGGVESGQNEEFIRRYSDRVPLSRMASAHEIVAAALFLASDAASYVTGTCLTVDGGLTSW